MHHILFCIQDAGTRVPAEQCRNRPVENQRTCTVLVYNLSWADEITSIRGGTEFFPTRQFGPDIMRDWDKRTSRLKVFLNLSGGENQHSNPNVLIECMQTLRNHRRPKLFTREEVSSAVSDVLDLKW